MSVFPRNMLGLRPVDYALTPEMQEVLRMAPEALTTTLRPRASLNKVHDPNPPHKQIDTLKTNRPKLLVFCTLSCILLLDCICQEHKCKWSVWYSLFLFLQAAGRRVRETGPVVLIGSQLTQTQQKQLAKAAQLLGGKQVKSFSSAGTSPLSFV